MLDLKCTRVRLWCDFHPPLQDVKPSTHRFFLVMGPPSCMFLLFMICSTKELRRVLLSLRIQNRPGAGSTFRSSGRSSISTWSRKSFQEPEACSAWAGFGLRCSWLIGCFRCFQVAIENHIGDLRRLGRFGSLKYVTSTNLLLGPFGPRSRKTSCPESQTRSLRWDSQTALPMYNAARSIILWPATIGVLKSVGALGTRSHSNMLIRVSST